MAALWLVVFLGTCLEPADQDPERIQKLIRSLADPNKEERERAVEDLVKIGRPALEALQKAATSSDSEVKLLAAQATEKIEWPGLAKLKKYVKEQLDDAANPEPSKLKGLSRWFPDLRLYEVAAAAPAGGAAVVAMGMEAPRSLFAIRKFEEGFHRLMVKGIFCTGSVKAVIRSGKIVLADEDAAVDFALAFMEIYGAGANQNATAMLLGGVSSLEKTEEGWALEATGYGTSMVFKTDKDGTLLEVTHTSNPGAQLGIVGGVEKGAEERAKLKSEKLKLEIELLKRQLEKK